VNDRIDVFLRGLQPDGRGQYETVPGYGTAGRAFYVGFDARF
jgi:hypothetical protein